MPYVDISTGTDYASLWYITNSPTGTVGGFDPAKPTVIMLHPIFLDSTWLYAQFEDPRLDKSFNIIAFDARCAGRTISRPNGRHDHWTDAADIAFACHALWLPPAHLWASESFATNAALRFAIIFPEMCLSVTLLTVPTPTELKAYFHRFDESLSLWSNAVDLDSLEHALMEVITFLLGPDIHVDLMDDLIAYLEMKYPPFRRSFIAEMANLIMNRTALTARELAAITQPVLLVHGDSNEIHPLEYAERMKAELVNAQGGAKLYVMKGAQGYLNVVHSCASLANQVFWKFMNRLPPSRSDPYRPELCLVEYMRQALERLAAFADEAAIATRDPRSPMSFSRVTKPVEESQMENISTVAKGQRFALSPLGADGRPMRKYTERVHDHWFQGDRDGISYASGTRLDRKSHELETLPIGAPTLEGTNRELVTHDVIHENALRRPAFTSPAMTSAERQVIKGSVSKVAAVTSLPIGRLFG